MGSRAKRRPSFSRIRKVILMIGTKFGSMVSAVPVRVLTVAAFAAQSASQSGTPAPHAALPPPPAPLGVPHPGPETDAPYGPLPILPGGVVVTLYPAGSPFLNMSRVREPEEYSLSTGAPGRVNNIVNIHNPSIEVHTVDAAMNAGAAVILAAGGGHRTLNVGSEGADFVPFFYNYGVNTIILRNRLRRDGYNPQTDETYDALQAIRMTDAPSPFGISADEAERPSA